MTIFATADIVIEMDELDDMLPSSSSSTTINDLNDNDIFDQSEG